MKIDKDAEIKYPKLRDLVRQIPMFVVINEQVKKAIEKYGQFSDNDKFVPKGATKDWRHKQLKRAMLFGTPPEINVMELKQACGKYLGGNKIFVHEPLVDVWHDGTVATMPSGNQKTIPKRNELLERQIVAICLHEMVHWMAYNNDPEHPLSKRRGPHDDNFGKEAFAGLPGWKYAWQCAVLILKLRGVGFPGDSGYRTMGPKSNIPQPTGR